MKTRKIKIISISVLLMTVLLFDKSYSQDFHLSQYDAATLYLNPALTGVYFKEKSGYRVYADYRSQWKSVSGSPYSTSYLAFDMPKNRLGLGGYIINNHSGSGGFNTFNFMLSGAYQITASKINPHYLSVGLQMGLINKSFNPDKFTFDSQYSTSSGSVFDESLNNNEIFNKTSLVKFDANMGVHYKYMNVRSKIHPFIGLSVFHVTMPDESFTDTEKRLPIRFVLHGGSDFLINEQLKLSPSVLFMSQDKAQELNLGILAYYNINETSYDFILGLNCRLDDAIIIQCGLKHDGHIFRISYDVNTSYLSSFSGNKGGVEFSLIYSGKKKRSAFQF